MSAEHLITKAELYRESGDFKSVREVFLTVYHNSTGRIFEPMLYFCNCFDRTLFLLIKDGQKKCLETSPQL